MRSVLALVPAAMALAVPAQAISLPQYANPGVENPGTFSYTAASDGNIVAFYANPVGAVFTDTLGMLVNGVDTGIFGLDNHSSTLGQSLDFGQVAAGDVFTFYIKVEPHNAALPAEMTFYSDPSRNLDGDNHVFSAPFAGGIVEGHSLPAGTFVAFEDLPRQGLFPPYHSDYNYTDMSFVFTNVAASAPEPASWSMMIVGFGLVGGTVRRQRRAVLRLTSGF